MPAASRSPSIIHDDRAVDPDAVDRAVTARDNLIRGFLADHLPAADGPLAAAKTCLYTMTPDGDFISIACRSAAGDRCRLALLRATASSSHR